MSAPSATKRWSKRCCGRLGTSGRAVELSDRVRGPSQPYFSAAVASALNDWLREESWPATSAYVRASSSRRSPPTTPCGDRGSAATLASSRCCCRSRQRAVEQPEQPRDVRRAGEAGLQVGLHAWAGGRRPRRAGSRPHISRTDVGNQPIAQAQVLSFVSEGVFERFPEHARGGDGVRHRLGRLAALALRRGLEGRLARGAVGQTPAVRVRARALPLHHRAGAPARPMSVAIDQLLEMMDGSRAVGLRIRLPERARRRPAGAPGSIQRRAAPRRAVGTAAEVYGLSGG